MGLQLPAVVRILGHEFALKVVGRDEAVSRHAVFETIGQTDLQLETITIRGPEDITPAKAAEVMLHETLHAVMCLFSLEGYLEDEHDEAFVNALAPALLHTLRENPALVEALMSDLRHPLVGRGEAVAVRHGHED